jgi:ankyrin repeat protein
MMLLQRGAYSFSELVHKFVQAGADIELTDNNGRTALLCCNFYEGAQLLIEKYQANINVISFQNETILFNAINQLPFPYTELLNSLVTLLCSKKPSQEMLNVKSLGAGETALFMLIQLSSKSIDTEKYKTIISNLLAAGADPDINCHGQTVFDISQSEIQRVLIDWKMKQQTMTNRSNTNTLSAGLTPSSNLLFFKDNGLIRYHFKHPTEGLRNNYSHYVDLDRELSSNELNQLSQILRLFPHSCHCLWYETFVDTHFQHVPQELLFIAANPYDGLGNTVLGVAAETGTQLQAAQLLIDMGANVNTLEHRTKRLALHWAICNKKSYFDKESYEAVEMVSLLLKNGADTELRCYQNSTPLEYARTRGYSAAADLIETHNRCHAAFRF